MGPHQRAAQQPLPIHGLPPIHSLPPVGMPAGGRCKERQLGMHARATAASKPKRRAVHCF